MQVQVNTSNGVENKDTLERWATDYLNEALARFSQDITRVEVQMRETSNSRNGAVDKRCMLEARIAGRDPVAATHHAPSQDEAFRGATQRLIHLLDHTLGKLDRHQHRDRDTIRKDPSAVE
ncbi:MULTISPECIES: HPF/RaiA family ribosome-associated protein [Ramlibacter]|uniref:HPF/RaiA family ribosome-associated protein n=1 Tax=Ramlibacter pinisoli TaxID=2682844 RepID=A0A6N8IS43_9BURK|nr:MULTISPECIES: HPF/RaiA family ribosome-associated protein [Ramlibacter]MBA2964064.1 HPF/RaiA family ribosome-associated protein [Ramlibacter sp. CGMCC 1.13660]MVQ29030.1 HPF/RaiA family ribosome-associated protein [Ramlibacter pinisoli]